MPTYQTIIVDITPGAKEKPVLNASQFDNGRPFMVALAWGGVPFTDAGDFDIEIHVKKPDGNIVTAEPDSVVNEVCSFLTTEQMCACHGINECEIVLYDNDNLQIGTGNFILDIEKAPDEGGIQSASEIHNLTQQIVDIVPQVLGDDYYNKTQTDALLANKADVSDIPDMTQYYDKSQTDTLLAAKADTSSLASVAFSGDYDDLINKPTIPAAQVQSDYAQADNTKVDYIKNKPDINAMIAAALLAVMPVETQTGNPCSFDTDIATALQSLTADILASGGGGTPSTPIPIVGHSELNLVRCGKNLLKNEQVQRTEYSVMIGQSSLVTYETYLEGSKNYHLQFEATGTSVGAYYKYSNGDQFNISSNGNFTPTRSGYVQMWLYSADLDISSVRNFMLELGSTPTAYAPYNGTPYLVSFGQTVYGGEYDANTGKVKPNIYYPSYNGETIIGRWLSSKDVYVEGATPTMGAQVVCLDEYDTEIDVPELSVDTIVGVNNIVSDCGGDVTASYKVSIQKYVDDN